MKVKTGICVFDIHFPKHNKKLWESILKVVKKTKPDFFIFGGDNLDMDEVNHWELDRGNKRGMEGKRLRRSYDNFQTEILDRLKLPDYCRKIFMLGNHECINKNSDVLTENGWLNIQEVTNEKIAQFDLNTGEITFDYPLEKIKQYSDKLIRIEGNKTYQEVTLNHDVVVDNKKVKAKDLVGKKIRENQMFLHGKQNNISCGFSEDDIRLLTWVVTDGTMVDESKYIRNSKKVRIQFKLSYQHKIDYLKKLLDNIGIKYTFKEATKSGINKLQPYYIRIYGDYSKRIFSLLNKVKEFPKEFRNMNRNELDIFLKELEKTDAHDIDGRLLWSSINKNNIDIIQESCIKNNIPFKYNLKEKSSGFKNGKPIYVATINNRNYDCYKLKIEKIDYHDDVYCFTMPKGTLITRLNGRVAFTGNCWLEQYIDKIPELEGFAEIERNLNLKDWEIIPYRQTVKVGKIYFHHGEYTGKHHASKMVDTFERNIVYGHLHSQQSYTKVTPIDCQPHTAISMPCACEVNPQYMKDRPSAWVNGFGVFYIHPDNNFNIYPVISSNGHFVFQGEYY